VETVEVTEVVQVEALSTSLTLAQSVDEVDLSVLTAQLSSLYGVPTSAIRLSLSGGSVLLDLQILTSPEKNFSSLAEAVLAVNDSYLSHVTSGSAVRSAAVSQVAWNESITTNTTVERAVDCRVGHWCVATHACL
jgi:hypothetical protein